MPTFTSKSKKTQVKMVNAFFPIMIQKKLLIWFSFNSIPRYKILFINWKKTYYEGAASL